MLANMGSESFIRTHMEAGVVAKLPQHQRRQQTVENTSQNITAVLEQQGQHTGMPKMS
mgnify:CR=1 FL=1